MHHADFENGDHQLYPAIFDRDGIVLWLCIWIIRINRTLGAIFDCADHLGVSALDVIHLALEIPIWAFGMAVANAAIFQIPSDT